MGKSSLNILQNIFYCATQKEKKHNTGFEQNEGVNNLFG